MTVFDFNTYPITDDFTVSHSGVVTREIMDDGTPRVRVLGGSGYRTTRLTFQPMLAATSDALLAFIAANRATSIDFGDYGTGYFWSDPTETAAGGLLRSVAIDIYAQVT